MQEAKGDDWWRKFELFSCVGKLRLSLASCEMTETVLYAYLAPGDENMPATESL